MDYSHIFQNEDSLSVGYFHCTLYRQNGLLHAPQCRYSMLFVLQGSVELRLRTSHRRIGALEMVMIDTEALIEGICADNTVVLEYAPPKRFAFYFSQSCKTFREFSSDALPILPPLQAWIEALLAHRFHGEQWTDEFGHSKRKELAQILIKYPYGCLGTLYAALTVCAHDNCEKCHEQTGQAVILVGE